MAAKLKLTGVEGGLTVEQGEDGELRLPAFPSRGFERHMIGRGPQEAIYLTQMICADGGTGHALAALMAWENAGRLNVAENGRLLREILHSVALIHAHLRQFYQVELPDYLPWSTLVDYDGRQPVVQKLRAGVAERPRGDWSRQGFEHPFSSAERNRLWEHRAEVLEHLELLQRMLALLGGKYPVVMSLVPGGVNVNLTEETLIRLRGYVAQVRSFLDEAVLDDGLLVVHRHPSITGLARGVPDMLSVGSGEDEAALEGALHPSGVLLADRLEPFAVVATESIQRAFYAIPPQGDAGGVATVPQPDKTGAYSWVKAPRYQGRPMEVGPIARLVIAYLSGARTSRPEFVSELERLLGGPIRRGNTVAGRLLARLGEIGMLLEHIEALLDQVDPAQPTVAADNHPFSVSGEGLGLLEAPAGALQHRVILERGRIRHYDIVTANTWNGASRDEQNQAGSVERALNRTQLDLRDPAQQRVVARIVHSFAFSASDAVH